jgi:hypothetical protein
MKIWLPGDVERGSPANPLDAVVLLCLTAFRTLDIFEVVLMITALLNPLNFVVCFPPFGDARLHMVMADQIAERRVLEPIISANVYAVDEWIFRDNSFNISS